MLLHLGGGLGALGSSEGEAVATSNYSEEPTLKPAGTAQAKYCRDKASRCTEWASAGECTRNPTFMHKECAASCGTCLLVLNSGDAGHEPSAPTRQPPASTTSASQPSGSPSSARPSEREPSMPSPPVDAAHQKAKQALNQELRCHAWAASGECERNPGYMRDRCREACAKTRREKEEA